MKIKVKNLGVIKEASIDLSKRLIVFCGPNNTGKTYISYLIYALTNISSITTEKFSNEQIQEIISRQEVYFKFNINSLYQFREKQLTLLSQNLSTIYGISDEKVNSFFSKFSIEYITTKEEYVDRLLKEAFEFTVQKNKVCIKISKPSNADHVLIANISETEVATEEIQPIVSYQLMSYIYRSLSLYPISFSEIFPVERNSIYTFNKELSLSRNIVIDQIQELGAGSKLDPVEIMNKRLTRYPIAVRDGLAIADDLVNIQNNRSKYASLADEIESDLLNGQVILSKEGEVQFVSNRSKSKKIPIHLSASIVKTLSSLTFYLRHRAKDNDLVIIDEPELNLHPNCQILLVRIFAKMMERGFRLLISTHSDYIIREINNLIMLHSINDEKRLAANDIGYSGVKSINHEEVAAYLFDFRTKTKVSVNPLEVDETGFEVDTIDNAIRGLNEASEELYYMVKYDR
jgi:predicted ATPase